MSHHLSDQLLAALSEFVTARFGLHFPRNRWRDLERRIGLAARDFGTKDVAACVRWLLATKPTPEQDEILARQLTIGETYFFREQKSFDSLERTVFPELIGARRGKDQRLRIWSAGCSTGEEPYSLAILLSRLIPDIHEWNVTILATDLNAQAVARARGGIYREWSFRGTPPWLKGKYFTRTGDGFEINAAIRNMVTFACLNLAEDAYPSLTNNTNAMDVIFCRNVLMYFEAEQARRVLGSFHRSLLAGGWLVVSPCETSYHFAGFETVSFPEAVFFRKDAKGRTVPAVPLHRAASEAMVIAPHLPEPVLGPQPSLSPLPSLTPPAAETAAPSDFDEAEALYGEGRYPEAADKLAGFLAIGLPEGELSPPYGEAAALLARTYANLGRLSDALFWSEKAIAATKLDPLLHYLRATIFQELGEPEEAIASLRRSLYLDHGFALAHFAMGNLTLQLGKSREADRHLSNTLELLRTHPPGESLGGAEGITVARLTEIVTALRESIGVR